MDYLVLLAQLQTSNYKEGKLLCADLTKAVEVYEAALATTFVAPRKGCLCFRFS